MIATASFIIPSPKSTAFRTGYRSGLIAQNITLINAIAATVSVAHITLLIIITYVKVRVLKMYLLIKIMNPVIKIKPMIVPTIPKNQIIPKLSKNKDFLRLNPAENIMGGKMIAKKS